MNIECFLEEDERDNPTDEALDEARAAMLRWNAWLDSHAPDRFYPTDSEIHEMERERAAEFADVMKTENQDADRMARLDALFCDSHCVEMLSPFIEDGCAAVCDDCGGDVRRCDASLTYTALPPWKRDMLDRWIHSHFAPSLDGAVYPCSSYGLKHRFEHYIDDMRGKGRLPETIDGGEVYGYLSNTQFKVAMALAGFEPVAPWELNHGYRVVWSDTGI